MIDFQILEPAQKEQYDRILRLYGQRRCEYSFANLYLWGRQRAALLDGQLAVFAQFNRRSVYLFPVGEGDKRPVLDAIIADARQRDIPCRLTCLTHDDCALLERLYPGRFRYHFDRDSFDYVYDIDDLATLKGRRFQRKRNHLNRFFTDHPDCAFAPITSENLPQVEQMLAQWYAQRSQDEPHGDFHMERAALHRALREREALGLEGLLLVDNGQILAMTMGSLLCADTFDVHFEKALPGYDGAYAAINQGFAAFLKEKYPAVRYLNREDDLGLEGLRKAKMSYCPTFLIEKNWACLLEDGYDY